MGAAISSTLTMGLTYCCCTAAGSLCNACLGSTAAGTTGRKRSVLLLTIAISLALWFQYQVGPAIVSESGIIWKTYRWIPGMGSILYKAWEGPCEQYDQDADKDNAGSHHIVQVCAGNAGVYRTMAVTTLFFIISAIATKVQPSLNREAWPAKYAIYFFAVALTMFLSSAPLFDGIYLWMARLGASLFLMLQQVILIDVAYNWNEQWVENADQADRFDYGSGAAWYRAIVGTCVFFYIGTITGIALLYKFYDCPENTWIITLTLLGVLVLTAIQLSGSEGSLLTSSVISLYVTYLAYSMVAKNPNPHCNPHLASNDVWGICIGLTLTAISLAWTGWSWTAQERLNVDGVQSTRSVKYGASSAPGGAAADNGDAPNLDVPFLDPADQPTAGLVMDSGGGGGENSSVGRDIWKLNVVMALISCWVAMILTGWGSIISDASMANPTAGRVNMAMIGISQWLAIGLYIWTLLAPRLFPDRDFS